MSRSTSFSLLRVPGLLSLVSAAVVSAAVVTACAGSDVPVRGDGDGVGANGGQTGSNGGSANAGAAGTDDGEGGSGMPAGGAGGASGAGGGDPQETGGTGGGSDCDGADIILTSCIGGACHNGAIGNFASSESDLLAAVGAPSNIYASCGSGVLIDDTDATQGVIYAKVSGSACGGQMPPGAPLSAADQACVEEFLVGLEQ
ncbi:MAG: hypothetical protein ABW217_14275 [Polyangiaceae bacterium]